KYQARSLSSCAPPTLDMRSGNLGRDLDRAGPSWSMQPIFEYIRRMPDEITAQRLIRRHGFGVDAARQAARVLKRSPGVKQREIRDARFPWAPCLRLGVFLHVVPVPSYTQTGPQLASILAVRALVTALP